MLEFEPIELAKPIDDMFDYGFDPNVAVLAIRRTRGVGVERGTNGEDVQSFNTDCDEHGHQLDHLASSTTGSNQQLQFVIDGEEVPNAVMGSSISTTSAAEGAGSLPSTSSSTTSLSQAASSVLRAVSRSACAYKMIFVANMGLKMGTGKLAAQVGHATLGVYRQAQKSDDGKKALQKWSSHGEVKIVVKGQTTEQLVELNAKAGRVGLFTYLVQDAGYTQIPPGSRTVLGIFGPVEAVDSITGQLKLL